MPTEQLLLLRLAVALAIGLLIGLERGWHQRDQPEGGRLAGIRTFGLIGLFGGALAALPERVAPWAVPTGLAVLGALLVAGLLRRGPSDGQDQGITTLVAALLTYGLGALAVLGAEPVAAAAAVVMALLLAYKPTLHGWVARLPEKDLLALLRLLVISVVVLPALPNQDYGPYGAFNPYDIWWMVVLIAGLSFVGYAAIQILGPDRGLAVTALAGGLLSSTAVTLSFSRLSRRREQLARPLAAGVLAATAISVVRAGFLAGILAPGLLAGLAVPLGAMAAVAGGTALLLWRRPAGSTALDREFGNPVALRPAIVFGLILAAVQFLVAVAQSEVGGAGVVAVAGISGLADVDALTLTVARRAPQGIEPSIAVMAITVAILANTATKAVMAGALGGGAFRRLVLPASLAVIAAGGAALAGLVLLAPTGSG